MTQRFAQFIDNLVITDAQLQDGLTKQAGVRDCLNRYFWGYSSETDNSLLIGSWGKQTRVRPSRDVDMIFLLPSSVFHRFQARTGNRQSQLLQEVKNALAFTYFQTAMRADGQVVVVPFTTTPIEVSPGFLCDDDSIIVCDANDGGRYVTSTARAEAAALVEADARTNGNTRRLARMFKQWQRHCDVPLKSFQIERLVVEFLGMHPNATEDYFYYDFLVRDFFAYLINRSNTYITMPGTGELIWLGSDWLTRAQTASRNALAACGAEKENSKILAGLYWQDIFGPQIPSDVS
ncbi:MULTISPECIES: SMODS domain-containing nucleotidyltransferase [Rhizobium]|uniref:SMODS domain-containing nucleotidyltransferase n=1 Tax=Rhizobium TaxID=379 RepID=UPI0028AEFD2E|nr:hypothetical protein [Agrobacterium sp. BT-220-3]